MTLGKNKLRMMTAAVLAAGLAYAAPAAAQATADLSLSFKSAPSTSINFGTTVTYSLTVDNLGPDAAEGVAIDFTAPAGTTVTSVTGCTPLSVPPDPVVFFPCTVPFSVLPSATTAPFKPTVTVTVSFPMPDPIPTTCPVNPVFAPSVFSVTTTTAAVATPVGVKSVSKTHTMKPIADIQLLATGPATISRDGGDYTFSFELRNLGPCASGYLELAVDDSVTTGFKYKSQTGCGIGGINTDAEYTACSLANDVLCGADADCQIPADPTTTPPTDAQDLGTCVPRTIDGDFLPDGSDYQYCDVGVLPVVAATDPAQVSFTKTYTSPALPSDLLSSNQGTGMQVVYYTRQSDPDTGNNLGDVTYVLTKSAGCAAAGGGASFMLIGLGLAALYLKRRRGA
jgi:uncharacterized repeat protein (TIGR01451 family)/uncharacterized protein (TIGR03382 family)